GAFSSGAAGGAWRARPARRLAKRALCRRGGGVSGDRAAPATRSAHAARRATSAVRAGAGGSALHRSVALRPARVDQPEVDRFGKSFFGSVPTFATDARCAAGDRALPPTARRFLAAGHHPGRLGAAVAFGSWHSLLRWA